MSNLPVNLLRFNGEIGPQYLDVEDKSGGPEGTMKPVTREVLQEMIMLNLPDVIDELGDIKQRQEAIDNKLDSVIENGSINTRLTGSIVELASGFNDITISAGSSIDLLSGINLIEQGFTKIRVVVRTGGTKLILQQRWRVGATTLRLIDIELTTGLYSNDFDFNVLSNNLTLSVLNRSSNVDDGVIIRAMILGVR